MEKTFQTVSAQPQDASVISTEDRLRLRDFEYAQPLHDLAFLLEIDALAHDKEVPKYRIFSLSRAAYSLDGYSTNIDRWLDGLLGDSELDSAPSPRIRQYLESLKATGLLPELDDICNERFRRCLRLRSVRGLGPSHIAPTVLSDDINATWLKEAVLRTGVPADTLVERWSGEHYGTWQAAHIVPPLLRFLTRLEQAHERQLRFSFGGFSNPFSSVSHPIRVEVALGSNEALNFLLQKATVGERQLQVESMGDAIKIKHRMGWSFVLSPVSEREGMLGIEELERLLDPLGTPCQAKIKSDLHLHSSWSDGSASLPTMAEAVAARGLEYFAVTDHSRSCKLQGGLTPALWLRQANSLKLSKFPCSILHGIEVDILKDGTLDLPPAILSATDIVVASVHSSWSTDADENTRRLARAIQSGHVDILGHPTSAVTGKPGVPDYVRPPANIQWKEIFESCAKWRVALEFNCFPSRFDLPLGLLQEAVDAGCWISLGSDAHSRAHLIHQQFGSEMVKRLSNPRLLNLLSYRDIRDWVAESREHRRNLPRTVGPRAQREFEFKCTGHSRRTVVRASPNTLRDVPVGSRIVGIDLTGASAKATGVALLDEMWVETCSLLSDDDLVQFILEHKPRIVSIDSPLGLPGGGSEIERDAGIMRVAEHDLASIGIPAYPALIDSMKELTLRGIRLRTRIESLEDPPSVIESYPGAAQDILSIPRKQRSLELLRQGLKGLGLTGPGLSTSSHDEMDAITSAIVGRFFEAGEFEPMGIPLEAQLIVPKPRPLVFDFPPVICLAGKTGVGKSTVARYLAVFFGFRWIKTRDLICQLAIEGFEHGGNWVRPIDAERLSEETLREFGLIVLERYKQEPLRRKLTQLVERCNEPIIVDAVRDIEDVDRSHLGGRTLVTWFIDSSESVVASRLQERSKLGSKRGSPASPVDRTAPSIRKEADVIVYNERSLEELRWKVDDALFDLIEIATSSASQACRQRAIPAASIRGDREDIGR